MQAHANEEGAKGKKYELEDYQEFDDLWLLAGGCFDVDVWNRILRIEQPCRDERSHLDIVDDLSPTQFRLPPFVSTDRKDPVLL